MTPSEGACHQRQNPISKCFERSQISFAGRCQQAIGCREQSNNGCSLGESQLSKIGLPEQVYSHGLHPEKL